MTKSRLEAFSDGVMAIIITIMVLELKAPHEPTFAALCVQYPLYLSYVLSFVNIGIYWNNHHHLFHSVKHISAAVMWANLHLLFWLSLMPIATAWAGESKFASVPVAIYGIDLGFCGLAYYILQIFLVRANGKESDFAKALGKDFKGKASVLIYLVAVPIAFVAPIVACLFFIVVAGMWLVPDKRFENRPSGQS